MLWWWNFQENVLPSRSRNSFKAYLLLLAGGLYSPSAFLVCYVERLSASIFLVWGFSAPQSMKSLIVIIKKWAHMINLWSCIFEKLNKIKLKLFLLLGFPTLQSGDWCLCWYAGLRNLFYSNYSTLINSRTMRAVPGVVIFCFLCSF